MSKVVSGQRRWEPMPNKEWRHLKDASTSDWLTTYFIWVPLLGWIHSSPFYALFDIHTRSREIPTNLTSVTYLLPHNAMKVKGACLSPPSQKNKEARMLLLREQHMNGRQVIRAETRHETSCLSGIQKTQVFTDMFTKLTCHSHSRYNKTCSLKEDPTASSPVQPSRDIPVVSGFI